jgi:SAM-dependent methyltransferase
MRRQDKMLAGINKTGLGLEIGPGYSPILPKQAGWNVLNVDHADQTALVERYRLLGVDTTAIEPVDIVWSGGALHEAVPEDLHGQFDYCLASHVIEHIPDPIAFFQSLARLLKPGGVLSLAIPDKRYTFDFFQPTTSTADWLHAWKRGATVHSRRAIFQHIAYTAHLRGAITWSRFDRLSSLALFTPDPRAAFNAFEQGSEEAGAPYVDCHAWHFTPASFALTVLELSYLGLIPMTVKATFPTRGCEFFVSLVNTSPPPLDEDALTPQRMHLLKMMVREQAEQWRALSPWSLRLPTGAVAVLRRLYRKVRGR